MKKMIMTAAIVCMAGIQMMAQPKLPYRNALSLIHI